MKIWITRENMDYEYETIIGVSSTIEKAKKVAQDYSKSRKELEWKQDTDINGPIILFAYHESSVNCSSVNYTVEEWTVDAPEK